MRWLTRIGGVQDPDGKTPLDLRMTFAGQKSKLRGTIEKIIGWEPQRVIFAHGRWYNSDGARELRRSFRWVLA
jgi:hypothetical protein